MKLIALGFKIYMKEKWNQLDVAIVILSVVGIVLEELETNIIPINPTIIRVMRVMRIARVLKLLKMAKGIRALLDTVMQALPQVSYSNGFFFFLVSMSVNQPINFRSEILVCYFSYCFLYLPHWVLNYSDD